MKSCWQPVCLLAIVALSLVGCNRANQAAATAAFTRGLAAAAKNNHAQAIKEYDESIRLDPTNHVAYYNRGVSRFELKQLDDAIRDCDECIKRKPDYAACYEQRAEAYIAKNENIKAQADITKAKQLNPKTQLDDIHPAVLKGEAEGKGGAKK